MNYNIMLAGVSGVGKTTLAQWIAETADIPFISGSYSDLVPETKSMPHQDMINQEPNKVFQQDMQVLNLRNKAFKNMDNFVTDRSYFDSAAYLINKLSHRLPGCELDHSVELCRSLLAQQCTHLIFIPFSDKFFNEWVIEDNNKRIQSKHYQFQVSQIMYGLLKLWNYKPTIDWVSRMLYDIDSMGTLEILGYSVKVLILDEMNFETRKAIVSKFLNL